MAAVADNCRFDERASSDRWRQFDALLSGLVSGRAVTDWQDWTEANQLHLDQKCNVASTSVPDGSMRYPTTSPWSVSRLSPEHSRAARWISTN